MLAAAAAETAAAAATKDKQDDDDPATGTISSEVKHIIDSILPLRAGLIVLIVSLITRRMLISVFRLMRRFAVFWLPSAIFYAAPAARVTFTAAIL